MNPFLQPNCELYDDLVITNVPAVLLSSKATPAIQKNAQTFLDIIYQLTGIGCPDVQPGNVDEA